MLVSHCLCIVNKLIKLDYPSPVMLTDMRALKAFCQNITTKTNSSITVYRHFPVSEHYFCLYQKFRSEFSLFVSYLYTNILNHESNHDLLKSLELTLLLQGIEQSEFSVCE